MNKYTLSFTNNELEHKYQLNRYGFTIPIFKGLNALGFIICALRSILSIILQEYLTFYIFLGSTIVVIITHFFILKYKKQWVDGYLIIMNHILMAYQYTVNSGYDFQEAYLFGQMMMTLHFLVIIICDFKYATIQLFNNLLIKVLIAILSNGKISLQTYLYTFLIALMALFVVQRTNKQYRQSFLFTINDNSQGSLIIIHRFQEKIFPMLLGNPFALFTFDNDHHKFQARMANLHQYPELVFQSDNQTNLIDLLRKYKIYGKTFEDFIFNRICQKESKYITNKTLELHPIERHKEKLLIKFSEIFITELMFVVVIDQKEHQMQYLKRRVSKLEVGIQKFTKSINKFFIIQLGLIQKSYYDRRSFYKMQTKLLYFVSKFTISKQLSLQNFNLINQIKHFTYLFQQAYNIRIICQFSIDQEIPIVTYKLLIKYLLAQLLMLLSKLKENNISLFVYNDDQYIDIAINIQSVAVLHVELQKNQSFRKILQIIGPFDKLIVTDDQLLIRLYQNMLRLKTLESYQQE